MAAVLVVLASLLLPAAHVAAAEAGAPAEAAKPAKISFPKETRFHGMLAGLPGPGKALLGSQKVLAVDEKRRRLYAMYVSETSDPPRMLVLNTYDLAPKGVPPLLSSKTVPGTGVFFGGNREPYSSVFDAKRQQVFMSATGNDGARIDRLDVKNGTTLPSFNVSTEAPGFSAVGMTHGPEENTLYLFGEFSGTSAAGILSDQLIGAYRGAPAVVALDAETGKRKWVRPVPECQQPLVTFVVGGLIARSELRDALYFFCHPGGSASFSGAFVGARNPGQSALIRLNIEPDATQADAAAFGVDVFPVSGSYKMGGNTGIAAFDAKTDRFIVQSRAPATPGAWVFDGRLDAWVGFITAPDANNAFLAVNPRTGRHYMGGQVTAGAPPHAAYLNIADSRLSPVPQGQTVPMHDGTGLGQGTALIALDPKTQRLFPDVVGAKEQIAVIEDTTPIQQLDDAVDFDALTADVEITDETLVQYSGGAAGFGANVRLAGGASGGYSGVPGSVGEVLHNTGVAGMPPCASLGINDLFCAGAGDRQVTFGTVPSVDIRESGASARATAVEVDQNTDAERDGTRNAVRKNVDGDDAEEEGPSQHLKPPFEVVDCLDGGGDPQDKQSPDNPFGAASVRCDVEKETVKGHAVSGNVAGAPVGITSTSFTTDAFKDAKLGAVTRSTATAKGIRIGDSAAQHLTIGKIVTTAQTVAAGRPGSTSVIWERHLSGVAVQDANGKDLFAAPGCSTLIRAAGGKKPVVTESGDCAALLEQVNAALKGRAKLRLPLPQIEATPQGAFAAVNKTQRDYLQSSTVQNDERKSVPAVEAVVLNDGEEKSRLVVQLAGIAANSIFMINNFGASGTFDVPLPPETPADSGAVTTDTSVVDAAPADSGVADAALDGGLSDPMAAGPVTDAALAPPIASGSIPARLAAGLSWLARTPGEALLVGAMWVLFGGAVAATARRLLLIRQLLN